MRLLKNSQAIFQQLAREEGSDGAASLSVKSVIENHDACVRSAEIAVMVEAIERCQAAWAQKSVEQKARIQEQRRRLEAVVTRIPLQIRAAG